MRPNLKPLDRFNGWFVKPIEKLKELPEGNGGFAVMMISIPLYERYIIAKLKLDGRSTSEEEIGNEVSVDLGLDDRQRRIFWNMIRNGFMHQALPKAGETKWVASDKYGELPEFKTYQGQIYICLDPWKFANRVLEKFIQDPRLISVSESFPLADVFSVSAMQKSTDSSGHGNAGTSGNALKDLP